MHDTMNDNHGSELRLADHASTLANMFADPDLDGSQTILDGTETLNKRAAAAAAAAGLGSSVIWEESFLDFNLTGSAQTASTTNGSASSSYPPSTTSYQPNTATAMFEPCAFMPSTGVDRKVGLF